MAESRRSECYAFTMQRTRRGATNILAALCASLLPSVAFASPPPDFFDVADLVYDQSAAVQVTSDVLLLWALGMALLTYVRLIRRLAKGVRPTKIQCTIGFVLPHLLIALAFVLALQHWRFAWAFQLFGTAMLLLPMHMALRGARAHYLQVYSMPRLGVLGLLLALMWVAFFIVHAAKLGDEQEFLAPAWSSLLVLGVWLVCRTTLRAHVALQARHRHVGVWRETPAGAALQIGDKFYALELRTTKRGDAGRRCVVIAESPLHRGGPFRASRALVVRHVFRGTWGDRLRQHRDTLQGLWLLTSITLWGLSASAIARVLS